MYVYNIICIYIYIDRARGGERERGIKRNVYGLQLHKYLFRHAPACYVCMPVCMPVCLSVCPFVCLYVCMHACLCLSIEIHDYVCMCTHVYV